MSVENPFENPEQNEISALSEKELGNLSSRLLTQKGKEKGSGAFYLNFLAVLVYGFLFRACPEPRRWDKINESNVTGNVTSNVT